MNNYTRSLFIGISVFMIQSSYAQASAKKIKSKPLKFNISLSSQVDSNINLESKEDTSHIFSSQFKIGTKLKKKIKRGMYLIDLPSADMLLAEGSSHNLRGYNISNTLIGLYLASRKHIFSFSSTQGFTKSISLNRKDENQENRFSHLSFDFKHDWGLASFFKLNSTVGTKIRDYYTKSDTATSYQDENDDWKQFVKIKGSFIVNKNIKFGPIMSASQKMFKNKRAYTKEGSEGGTQAQKTRLYKLGSFFNINLSGLKLGAKLETLFNDDRVHGADDYTGANYKGSISKDLKVFDYKLTLSLKQIDYKSQQEDIDSRDTFATLYTTDITNITNNFTLPKNIFGKYNIGLEHKYQKFSTNRINENYTNQIFKMNMNFTY